MLMLRDYPSVSLSESWDEILLHLGKRKLYRSKKKKEKKSSQQKQEEE